MSRTTWRWSKPSTADIAQRLQRSLAWVRTTLCRLRQQLRECIETAVAKETT